MRAVFSFFSMLALGLMIAAIIMVGATDATNPIRLPATGVYLDYASVVIGLGIGLVIAILGQISWGELPRRAVEWVIARRRKLRLLAWAALFVAVLIYF